MTDYLLLIYPIALLYMTLYSSEISPRGQFNEIMWDRRQTLMIQTFSCFGVILHHLTQDITAYGQNYKGPITMFSSMGILFTAIFFFSSGYGLLISLKEKPGYLDSFISHRFPVVLVPFFIANVINTLVRIYYLGIPTSGMNLVKCLLGVYLLNGNGWFIVEIIFLYLFFYIIFKLIKNQDAALVLMCVATCLMIIYAFNNGRNGFGEIGDRWFKGEWWYNSTIVFGMGMIFARFKDSILVFCQKYYRVILPVTVVLFLVTFGVEEVINNVYGYYREGTSIDIVNSKLVTLFSQMLVCIIWTFMILLINMKIRIGNRVLTYFSSISTELFLIHGIFNKNIFEVSQMNHLLSYFLVILFAIVSAILMHFIDKPIITILQGVGRKETYLEECEIDLIRLQKEKKRRVVRNTIFASIAIVAVIIACIKIYNSFIGANLRFEKEIQGIKKAKVGDEIIFGRMETDYVHPGKEELMWIVLDKSDDVVILVTKKGIAGSVYHKNHKEIEWKQSDLYKYVNEDLYNKIFTDKEKDIIIDNPNSKDRLSLLSVEEAYRYFSDDEARQLDITDVALKSGTNINEKSKVNKWDIKGYRSSWWWLRGEDKAVTAPIVTSDGEIVVDSKAVNKPNGAVRPVVYIELK